MKGTTPLTREEPLRLRTSLFLNYLNESSKRVLVSCKMETEQEVVLQLTGARSKTEGHELIE